MSETKRKKRPAYVPRPWEGCVADAVSEAFSEFQSLAEEMREACDNMEGANMEHLPKYELTSEAASVMEEHADEPDVPGDVGELRVEASVMVPNDKRRQPSRATRLSNATGLLLAVRDRLEEVEEPEDPVDGSAEVHEAWQKAVDLKEHAEQLVSDLDEHCEFDVEFPGMFG